MSRMRAFLSQLWALLRSRQMDRDLDDEIASHLAEATAECIQKGLSPEEARLAALREFGGVTQAKDVYRQVRSFTWLDDLRVSSQALASVCGPRSSSTGYSMGCTRASQRPSRVPPSCCVRSEPLPFGVPSGTPHAWIRSPHCARVDVPALVWCGC